MKLLHPHSTEIQCDPLLQMQARPLVILDRVSRQIDLPHFLWKCLISLCNPATQSCWLYTSQTAEILVTAQCPTVFYASFILYQFGSGARPAWLLRVQLWCMFPDQGSKSRRWRSTSLRCKDPRKKLIIWKRGRCPLGMCVNHDQLLPG